MRPGHGGVRAGPDMATLEETATQALALNTTPHSFVRRSLHPVPPTAPSTIWISNLISFIGPGS